MLVRAGHPGAAARGDAQDAVGFMAVRSAGAAYIGIGHAGVQKPRGDPPGVLEIDHHARKRRQAASAKEFVVVNAEDGEILRDAQRGQTRGREHRNGNDIVRREDGAWLRERPQPCG